MLKKLGMAAIKKHFPLKAFYIDHCWLEFLNKEKKGGEIRFTEIIPGKEEESGERLYLRPTLQTIFPF